MSSILTVIVNIMKMKAIRRIIYDKYFHAICHYSIKLLSGLLHFRANCMALIITPVIWKIIRLMPSNLNIWASSYRYVGNFFTIFVAGNISYFRLIFVYLFSLLYYKILYGHLFIFKFSWYNLTNMYHY